MPYDNLKVLEWLSLIYEDLDIDTVEHRFVDLVEDVFSFDRIALFFVKHHRGVLCGKLSKGFEEGVIKRLEIPISENFIFTSPLITGIPLWNQIADNDPFIKDLGLTSFAVVPIINKKRISCWEITNCKEHSCPAYGNKWVRCWLVSGTKCGSSHELTIEEKQRKCDLCPVHKTQNAECVEGVLLVDNSASQTPIGDDVVMMLSMIGHTVGAAIDNSKRFEKTLRIAIKDDLTGLYNRRYFNERLLGEIERVRRYPEEPVSLLLIDIDLFKNVNDTFGHQRGDSVLIWFSQFLQKTLRKSDILARYGGEEFGIILINTELVEAYEVAEDIRRAVRAESVNGTGGIEITISIGVATFSEKSHTFEGLISKADKALYSAKAQGRNKTIIFE
nr:diguanylate cyclase [Desulfobulbaceae bacterium]